MKFEMQRQFFGEIEIDFQLLQIYIIYTCVYIL